MNNVTCFETFAATLYLLATEPTSDGCQCLCCSASYIKLREYFFSRRILNYPTHLSGEYLHNHCTIALLVKRDTLIKLIFAALFELVMTHILHRKKLDDVGAEYLTKITANVQTS